MTVTADETWTATPVTGATFVTNGLVREGSTTGADIAVPDGGNLYGGDRFEIELTIR